MYFEDPHVPTSPFPLGNDSARDYADRRYFHGLAEESETKPQCDIPCRALQSLRRAAEGICRLAGPFSLECIKARLRLLQARARIMQMGCDCPEPPPPPPPPVALAGYGGFGQMPSRRTPSLLTDDLQLRMPSFETITGFPLGGASLNAAQIERINRTAEFIANSWNGTSAITSVRVTGYINGDEWQPDLGQQRAVAVRDALVVALNRLRAGLATRLRWITEDRGLSIFAKVEIYLWAGPTAPPVPPLIRVPSPAEVARRMVPMGPETPEQRIQRILRTLPPPPPSRRSFNQMFWQRVDEQLDSTMSRLNVPRSLRGHIRDGAHAAIRRGSEALLNQIVGATGLPSQVQEGIRGTVRALLEVPISP